MRAILKKSGDSASVRIPAAVLKAADIHGNTVVDITEEDGRVVIVPVGEERLDLNQLLAGITSENIHEEADFGAPTGREAL